MFRVPLIISDPRYKQGHGQHYRYPVELIDFIPTLVDLTNTPLEREEECDPHVNEQDWGSPDIEKAKNRRQTMKVSLPVVIIPVILIMR